MIIFVCVGGILFLRLVSGFLYYSSDGDILDIFLRHMSYLWKRVTVTFFCDTYIRGRDSGYGRSGSCVCKPLSFLGCDIGALCLGQGMFWKKGKSDFFCAP